MKKEMQSRETRMGKVTNLWVYCRYGLDDRQMDKAKPTAAKKPEQILFNEAAMQIGWLYSRFGVTEK